MGSWVARSSVLGNPRASKCGTSDDTDSHAFLLKILGLLVGESWAEKKLDFSLCNFRKLDFGRF